MVGLVSIDPIDIEGQTIFFFEKLKTMERIFYAAVTALMESASVLAARLIFTVADNTRAVGIVATPSLPVLEFIKQLPRKQNLPDYKHDLFFPQFPLSQNAHRFIGELGSRGLEPHQTPNRSLRA